MTGSNAGWLTAGAWDDPVLRLPNLPVFCNALLPTEAEAIAAPSGDLVRVYSPETGYRWNRAFDPALAAYNPAYENSLHYSPRFVEFVTALADRLIARYDLRDRNLVEIGSGEGNFLALLCERGGNRGLGFDPSFDPARHKVVASERMTVVPEYYPIDRAVDADFVLCQHVLEHVPDPAALVAGVHASLAGTATPVYFEMPDATYMVEQLAVWDLIYEHVSYFAAPTLRLVFERAGFEVLDIDRAFGDQYLHIEAVPGGHVGATPDRDNGPALADPAALAKLTELVTTFGDDVERLRSAWTERLGELVSTGTVAVWGAGSKGVTFLNLVPPGQEVRYVVDVNPNKVGLHLPGTGQRVVSPDDVAAAGVDTVVVMNPLYVEEIRAQLAELGAFPRLVAVTD
jgi:SAM-dependent methyltransferase